MQIWRKLVWFVILLCINSLVLSLMMKPKKKQACDCGKSPTVHAVKRYFSEELLFKFFLGDEYFM